MLGNKEAMAKNIKKYMDIKGVNATDVCKALGFKHNTFSGWVNAKIYPRIDKIEMMANYFGCSKADLVEEEVYIPEFSPKHIQLLDLFSKLSAEQQDSFLTLMSTFLSDRK